MSLDVLERVKEFVRPFYLKWLFFRLSSENYPSPFKRWLHFPSCRLGADAGGMLPEAGELSDIIFLPMADWHGILQRSQQLARGLAKLGHRCIYLNPHLGREFPETYPFSRRRVVSQLEERIIELHVHLALEPVFHHRCLLPSEVAALAESLRQLLTTIESRSQILVLSFPLWLGVACQLRDELHAPIIYDCHDLLRGFEGISADLLEAEENLLETADMNVFSAAWLERECNRGLPSRNAKSIIIRNAANSQDFDGIPQISSTAPSPVTIGYIGSLNSWFDLEALTAAARAHPEWRFLLVGPAAESFPREALRMYQNVSLIGEVPHGDLPQWMARFTVATIPFIVQPLTRATNPIKMYEYFAAGLPVVSSPLGEVERYAELIYTARTPAEFVRQLEIAAAENDPAKRLARRRIAQKESWAARSAVFSREAQGLLGAIATISASVPAATQSASCIDEATGNRSSNR